MLWSDDVLNKGDRAAKRLWLAGTIAAGLAANRKHELDENMVLCAVTMADAILEELTKGDMK